MNTVVSFISPNLPKISGTWRIGILYEGEHIRGSPFVCEVSVEMGNFRVSQENIKTFQVFDPSLVNVYGLDVGLVGQELRFTVNASQAGHGNIKVSVKQHF